MTLLELLVKELPKRGGWPEDVWHVTQDSDGQVNGYGDSEPYRNTYHWNSGGFIRYLFDGESKPLSVDWGSSVISPEQYEAAIAAQQPAWNGEGLPPVGSECEVAGQFGDGFYTCKILAHTTFGNCAVAVYQAGENVSTGYAGCFRKIRTEADRKREDSIAAMREFFGHASGLYDLSDFYDGIAAGKIPGVELSK